MDKENAKVKLEIIGISYSQTQTGAYALILGETSGKRRLPIIIGGFEAQAIAIELEKMKPTRPLTHDLFKSFADTFNIAIQEVIIYKFVEGIFFGKLICHDGANIIEIDARTSDAVALAVRFKCPIFTFESILSTAGILIDEKTEIKNEDNQIKNKLSDEDVNIISDIENEIEAGEFDDYSDKELKDLLQQAVEEEAFEKASKIRDELNKRKASK